MRELILSKHMVKKRLKEMPHPYMEHYGRSLRRERDQRMTYIPRATPVPKFGKTTIESFVYLAVQFLTLSFGEAEFRSCVLLLVLLHRPLQASRALEFKDPMLASEIVCRQVRLAPNLLVFRGI